MPAAFHMRGMVGWLALPTMRSQVAAVALRRLAQRSLIGFGKTAA